MVGRSRFRRTQTRRFASRQASKPSKTEQDDSSFTAHVSSAEHFPGVEAADHGQQACPDKTNRCRPTSAVGCRLPCLQLATADGGRELVVVSK